jgi:hypothetical protein
VILLDPEAKPLKFFVGEGHRQDMIDFVQVALEVFKDQLESPKIKELPTFDLGQHLNSTVLRFPGKIHLNQGRIFIADSGNHRILITGKHFGDFVTTLLKKHIYNILVSIKHIYDISLHFSSNLMISRHFDIFFQINSEKFKISSAMVSEVTPTVNLTNHDLTHPKAWPLILQPTAFTFVTLEIMSFDVPTLNRDKYLRLPEMATKVEIATWFPVKKVFKWL